MNKLVRTAVLAASATSLALLAPSPAQAASECVDRLSADLASQGADTADLDAAVAQACTALTRETAGTGFDIDDAAIVAVSGGVATDGSPRAAFCLLYGAISGPNSAIYTLVGVAGGAGVAAFTRIACSASPSGVAFNTLAPGSASGGADATTSPLILPGAPLAPQCVTTYGAWQWILGSGGAITDTC